MYEEGNNLYKLNSVSFFDILSFHLCNSMTEHTFHNPDNLDLQLFLSQFSEMHPGVLEAFWHDSVFLSEIERMNINQDTLSTLQKHEIVATLIAPPTMRAAFMYGPMRAILSYFDFDGYEEYLSSYARNNRSIRTSFNQTKVSSDSFTFAFQAMNNSIEQLVNTYGKPVLDILVHNLYLNARFRLYTNLQSPEDVLRDSFHASFAIYRTIMTRCIALAKDTEAFADLHASDTKRREQAHIQLIKQRDIPQIAKDLTRTSNGFVTPILVAGRQLYDCIELSEDRFRLNDATSLELQTNLRNHNAGVKDTEENESYLPELGTSSGCPFGHRSEKEVNYSDDPLDPRFMPIHLRQRIVDPIDAIHGWICHLAQQYYQQTYA